jgi:hypothetical protein
LVGSDLGARSKSVCELVLFKIATIQSGLVVQYVPEQVKEPSVERNDRVIAEFSIRRIGANRAEKEIPFPATVGEEEEFIVISKE